MSESYDPNSQNAVTSRIFQRLDKQDEDSRSARAEIIGILSEIRVETKKTNGRVTALEQWRATTTAKIVLLVGLGSGAVTVGMWIFDRLSR